MAWRCPGAPALLRRLEPVIVLQRLGSALFDTALQVVVQDRTSNASSGGGGGAASREESQQRAMTNFYMIYNLIVGLTPVVPALLLAEAGDRGWRRAPIVVPLCGYLLSRLALLLLLLLRLPLEVMFGAAALFGLSGGFCAYWPGVITLASLGSTTDERSKVMMKVELLYGLAGLLGSLVSGHLFHLYSSTLGNGTVLVSVSALLHLLCLLHSVVLLQVKPAEEDEASRHLLSGAPCPPPEEQSVRKNAVNVALLFASAVLYGSSVGGAVEILGIWVLKEPLGWNAMLVGYGNAAGCVIFLTSFLGVIVLRRCLGDVELILMGMVSFASGIYFMSFVTTTLTFYLARSLNLFALIPLPTVRSLLSKQVPVSSCGITLTALQLALKLAGLAYIPASSKIYQATLGWFPGFVFMLSSVFTVLAMVPISVVGCRMPQQIRYERILGD